MSEEDKEKSKVGTIVWRDLTVDNAEEVREFYQKVVGWNASGCDMGNYEDYNMEAPASGETIFYLVSGTNCFGSGSAGDDSGGTPRSMGACS